MSEGGYTISSGDVYKRTLSTDQAEERSQNSNVGHHKTTIKGVIAQTSEISRMAVKHCRPRHLARTSNQRLFLKFLSLYLSTFIYAFLSVVYTQKIIVPKTILENLGNPQLRDKVSAIWWF